MRTLQQINHDIIREMEADYLDKEKLKELVNELEETNMNIQRTKDFLNCLGNGKTLDEIETEELEMEQEDE